MGNELSLFKYWKSLNTHKITSFYAFNGVIWTDSDGKTKLNKNKSDKIEINKLEIIGLKWILGKVR